MTYAWCTCNVYTCVTFLNGDTNPNRTYSVLSAKHTQYTVSVYQTVCDFAHNIFHKRTRR